MQPTRYLITPLMEGFEWFDDGLQSSLKAAGWAPVTRSESMVIMHVLTGTNRPADIARALRLSRQAVHSTIDGLVEAGFFARVDDPEDGRIKILVLAERGMAMHNDANAIVDGLVAELEARIGKRRVRALREAFEMDWGSPPVVPVKR
ncbi:MarR family transcriptional regulator [Novosphingobium kunmingense]|uniref:MarR family transcriptional regulator n=1 Tax=Novosphingobium kunmingense TaxID=1211806 RepID=A0A2N0H392_9SPHN|nr:MarR family transcriptional regulator [Novosphingobium kunmingense]PKB13401.1 MarR family transcriptional regulator [Novosphingobium kunmingense]